MPARRPDLFAVDVRLALVLSGACLLGVSCDRHDSARSSEGAGEGSARVAESSSPVTPERTPGVTAGAIAGHALPADLDPAVLLSNLSKVLHWRTKGVPVVVVQDLYREVSPGRLLGAAEASHSKQRWRMSRKSSRAFGYLTPGRWRMERREVLGWRSVGPVRPEVQPSE